MDRKTQTPMPPRSIHRYRLPPARPEVVDLFYQLDQENNNTGSKAFESPSSFLATSSPSHSFYSNSSPDQEPSHSPTRQLAKDAIEKKQSLQLGDPTQQIPNNSPFPSSQVSYYTVNDDKADDYGEAEEHKEEEEEDDVSRSIWPEIEEDNEQDNGNSDTTSNPTYPEEVEYEVYRREEGDLTPGITDPELSVRQMPYRPQPEHLHIIKNWARKPNTPQEQLARRVVYILNTGLVGCPRQEHIKGDSQHQQYTSTSCQPIVPDQGKPAPKHTKILADQQASKAEKSGIGLQRRNNNIPPILRGASRAYFPSSERLDKMFHGPKLPEVRPSNEATAEQEDGMPLHLCIQQSHTALVPAAPVTFDIDSSITIFSELDCWKRALALEPVFQPTQLLSSSIHLTTKIEYYDDISRRIKTKTLPIHKIPHTVFARDFDSPIFIFFPRLYKHTPGKRSVTNHLTENHVRHFYDKVLAPSLWDFGENTFQYVPKTYTEVKLKAEAPKKEEKGISTTRGGRYRIPVADDAIGVLWQKIRELLQESEEYNNTEQQPPELDWHFTRPFFLYDRKNTKHEHRTSDIASCIDNFYRREDSFIQIPTIENYGNNQQYIDIAAEFCARQDSPLDPSYTLLARRCCQRANLEFIYSSQGTPLDATESTLEDTISSSSSSSPSKQDDIEANRYLGPSSTEYPVHLLRDTICITSEPLKKSLCYQAGLQYFQSYSVSKTAFDAQGTYPYSHPGIIHLGYSQEDFKSIAYRSHIPHSRESAELAFKQSTERVYHALNSGHGYGWRCEFRVSTTLARLIRKAEVSWQELLVQLAPIPNEGEDLRIDIPTPPESFYIIPTSIFSGFQRENINKCLLVLDTISAHFSGSHERSTPQATAALYAVVALYLRHFISYMKPSIAWMFSNSWDKKVSSDARPGLGLTSIMEEQGFGYLPRIIDWQDLTINADAYQHIYIPEFIIRQRRQQYLEYREAKHLWDKVIGCSRHVNTPEQGSFYTELVVHCLLREYRHEAIQRMFPSARSSAFHTRLREDRIECTIQSFRSIANPLQMAITPMTGNRAHFKSAFELFLWTWDSIDVGYKRDFILSCYFRTMYKEASRVFKAHQNSYLTTTRLQTVLFHRFFQQHSAIPYPDSNGTLVSTKKNGGDRIVFCTEYKDTSIVAEDLRSLSRPEDCRVVILRDPQLALTQAPVPSRQDILNACVVDRVEGIVRGLGRAGEKRQQASGVVEIAKRRRVD